MSWDLRKNFIFQVEKKWVVDREKFGTLVDVVYIWETSGLTSFKFGSRVDNWIVIKTLYKRYLCSSWIRRYGVFSRRDLLKNGPKYIHKYRFRVSMCCRIIIIVVGGINRVGGWRDISSLRCKKIGLLLSRLKHEFGIKTEGKSWKEEWYKMTSYLTLAFVPLSHLSSEFVHFFSAKQQLQQRRF